MSVSYGRYVISYDSQEKVWNADPKRLKLVKHKETVEYSYPKNSNSRPMVFIEPTKDLLEVSMRKNGCRVLSKRKNEWVVSVLKDTDQSETD